MTGAFFSLFLISSCDEKFSFDCSCCVIFQGISGTYALLCGDELGQMLPKCVKNCVLVNEKEGLIIRIFLF